MGSDKESVVAVFESHRLAEDTIRHLQKSGFDMTKLSMIGKDHDVDENGIDSSSAGECLKHSGKSGAFCGGFWGMLFGAAFIWLPGIGTVRVAGPIVVWLAGALETAAVVGGLGALRIALFGIGIPKNSVRQFETEVKNGKFLLVARGTSKEVERAKDLLDQTGGDLTSASGKPAGRSAARRAPLGPARSRFPNKRGSVSSN